MGYYDLSKEEREILKKTIEDTVLSDFRTNEHKGILSYSTDDDTYIRKNVYLAIGRLYKNVPEFRSSIISILDILFHNTNEKVRQTVVYALGEIGKIDFDDTREIFGKALTDGHHSVLNAVTGALKQLGEKNPKPTLEFVKELLRRSDARAKEKLLHGLELRGRTHPEDILPILFEYQNDPDKKVIKTIVHILGQISYKKGCLETVVHSLKKWENRNLIGIALQEILTVHRSYSRFAHLSFEEAQAYIKKEFDWE